MFGLLLIATGLQSAFGAGGKHAWGYDGGIAPEHWAKQYPMCGGDTQSGRDIIVDRTVEDPKVCRAFRPGEWTMEANSHHVFQVGYSANGVAFSPVQQNPLTKEWVPKNTRNTTIARLPNQLGRVKGVHGEFCFHSMHFHWGSVNEGGSEHNVNGVRYPLELHFVHFSCDYNTLGEALADSQGNVLDKYVLGVVGVMFELGGSRNRAFDDILNAKRAVGGKSALVSNLMLDDLLPRGSRAFYAYEGSLTTPPCNPVVRWHVMAETVTISPEQLDALKQLSVAAKFNIQKNYRPVQRNKNDVYHCAEPVKPELILPSAMNEKGGKAASVSTADKGTVKVNNHFYGDGKHNKAARSGASSFTATAAALLVTFVVFLM